MPKIYISISFLRTFMAKWTHQDAVEGRRGSTPLDVPQDRHSCIKAKMFHDELWGQKTVTAPKHLRSS